jgi:hypothetical protein
MPRVNRLAIILLSVILVIILAGCSSPPAPVHTLTPIPTPTVTPTPWSPDRNHILVIPREYFAQFKDSYPVDVPPASYLIIPVSVGQYEHLAGWGWYAKGTTEDYLDSWLVNSSGTKISESGRVFNFGTQYAFDNNPGLGPGTYYIYLSNEFTSTSAKQVTLRIKWNP